MSDQTSFACTIGIDFGQTTIKGGLVCQNGDLLYPENRPTKLGADPESVVADFLEIIASLQKQAAAHSIRIHGIGLSSTVDVNTTAGCFRENGRADLKKWSGFPIAPVLSQRAGMPVIAENDGIAAAWGEYRVGSGAGYSSMINLMLGTGIGGGAILENQLLPATLGAASNFGHMCINFTGPLCPCGQKGCWELYVSGSALEKKAQRLEKNDLAHLHGAGPLTGKMIIDAARDGNPICRSLLEEQGHYLGIGLASLSNIFNPDVFIIGGGLMNAGDLLLESARKQLVQTRIPVRDNIPIIKSKLGTTVGIVGAGLFAWDKMESNYGF